MSFDVCVDLEFLSSYRTLCVPRTASGVNLFTERGGGRERVGERGMLCVYYEARACTPHNKQLLIGR